MGSQAIKRCRYCTKQHAPNLLCAPAKRVLDAMVQRGMDMNMPTLEFPTVLPGAEIGVGLDGPGDRLVSQVVLQAATVPVAGVLFPAVVITGQDVYGATLPHWLYAADPDGMADLVTLVTDITSMAVRAAAEGRTVG